MRTPAPRRAPAAAAILAAALAAGACKEANDGAAPPPASEAPPAEQGPPPLSETEAERGRKACASYRDEVCAAAEDDPSLEEACRLAESRIEALEDQLGALAVDDQEQRRILQANARRIIKHCFEKTPSP